MVKQAILLLAIVISINAVTYRDFTEAKDICFQVELAKCYFNAINIQGQPLSNQLLQCAQDYQKSNVCFYGYSQCYAKDSQSKSLDEMPLVCWNCYMESPSKSQQYESFRKCLANAYQSKLLLSLALVFIMLMLL